jgi:hypothetical protein
VGWSLYDLFGVDTPAGLETAIKRWYYATIHFNERILGRPAFYSSGRGVPVWTGPGRWCSEAGLTLIRCLLTGPWPNERLSLAAALQHPYLQLVE